MIDLKPFFVLLLLFWIADSELCYSCHGMQCYSVEEYQKIDCGPNTSCIKQVDKKGHVSARVRPKSILNLKVLSFKGCPSDPGTETWLRGSCRSGFDGSILCACKGELCNRSSAVLPGFALTIGFFLFFRV